MCIERYMAHISCAALRSNIRLYGERCNCLQVNFGFLVRERVNVLGETAYRVSVD